MTPNLSDRLDQIKRKPAAASLRAEAKADRKFLAVDWKRKQGTVFARVLELGRMSLQDAAYAMGYRDASAVSRWVSSAERVQWDRVAEVDQLRPWIPVAWGEVTGAELQTTVIIRMTA